MSGDSISLDRADKFFPSSGIGEPGEKSFKDHFWITHVFPGGRGGWRTGLCPTPCKAEEGELAGAALDSRVMGSNCTDLHPLESYFKYVCMSFGFSGKQVLT